MGTTVLVVGLMATIGRGLLLIIWELEVTKLETQMLAWVEVVLVVILEASQSIRQMLILGMGRIWFKTGIASAITIGIRIGMLGSTHS